MSRSRMLELLEPRQLLSADVLESSLVVDQPVLSMPALSVDAGKLERFAADDMLLIRTDGGEDGSWVTIVGEEDPPRKKFFFFFSAEILGQKLTIKLGGEEFGQKKADSPTTQPSTQPSTERWRDLAE